jgi:hypothetical protein
MIKVINEKTYFKRDGFWYGTNKDGLEYRVFQSTLLSKLNEPEGLGDVISSLTKKLGINECAGCKKRKQTLNTIFPFTKKKSVREITEQEITYMSNLKEGESSKPLFDLYNDLFFSKLEVCACPGLQKTIIDRINLAIDIQKDEK